MSRSMSRRGLVAVLSIMSLAALTVLQAPIAVAAVPNDEIGGAITLTLPTNLGEIDFGQATPGIDDPTPCWGGPNTLWYRYTPATDQQVVWEAWPPIGVEFYTGEPGNLSSFAPSCGASSAAFNLPGGTTYWIMLAGDGIASVQFRALATPTSLTIDRVATVQKTPDVITRLSGTVTCSIEANVTIEVYLRQIYGRGVFNELSLGVGTSCGTDVRHWQLDAYGYTLKPGRASAFARASTYDANWSSDLTSDTQAVLIRPIK